MWCPRLSHFVRLNSNGTVSRCGHMVQAPQFGSLDEMNNSWWQRNTEHSFLNGIFPSECVRCQQTEQINETSIRLNAIDFDNKQVRKDYLCVGGVLDNTCNSACQSCNEKLSTKIGSLRTRDYPIVDNTSAFWSLPMSRVVHLDINGGEPSASKNYKNVLQNIPASVDSVRINTNCSLIIPEIEGLLERGIHVTVTVSLDGIENTHDYVRWPIKWDKFYSNLMIYKSMGIQDLNTWTTVHALNIGDMHNIFAFVKEHNLDHSYALLNSPDPLNVKYKNSFTEVTVPEDLAAYVAIDRNNEHELKEFIAAQDALRNINYTDYGFKALP